MIELIKKFRIKYTSIEIINQNQMYLDIKNQKGFTKNSYHYKRNITPNPNKKLRQPWE